MATDTKGIAERFRIEADHGEDNVIFDMSDCLFDDSVPMAIGVDGIDDMDMHVYKPADIIDLQSS